MNSNFILVLIFYEAYFYIHYNSFERLLILGSNHLYSFATVQDHQAVKYFLPLKFQLIWFSPLQGSKPF